MTYKRFGLITFCFLLLLGALTKNDQFMAAVSYLVYPAVKVQNSLHEWLRDRELRLRDNAELINRIQTLEHECDMVREENIMLHSTGAYYDSVAEVISFKERYESQARILVQIIGRVLTDRDHYILVDAGKNRTITRNMVALYHNAIIGVVEEVYPRYAKVRLVTDKRCKVSVSCVGTGGSGIHKGTNNTQMTEIAYMSHLATVLVGDRVVSSGEGAIFPQGFLVGSIDSYERDGLYHRIAVVPAVDIATIRYCDLIASHGIIE